MKCKSSRDIINMQIFWHEDTFWSDNILHNERQVQFDFINLQWNINIFKANMWETQNRNVNKSNVIMRFENYTRALSLGSDDWLYCIAIDSFFKLLFISQFASSCVILLISLYFKFFQRVIGRWTLFLFLTKFYSKFKIQ